MIYTVTFNPAIDYVVRLDSPLEVGEVNRARGEDCVLGGKGINVSGVLAELGCQSVALGFVAGETGAWLERGLAAQGIQTDFIHLAQGMTRINVKIKAGQETELNGAGPNIPESAMQALEAKLDTLQNGDILILAGSIPASLAQTTYERLLARLEGRGVRAVVDATRDLLVNVLPFHPFLIKPNNHELGEIFGMDIDDDGFVELPSVQYLQKLENQDTRTYYLVDWYNLDADGGKHTKLTTYYNAESGWYLKLPPAWRGKVLVHYGEDESGYTGYGFYLYAATPEQTQWAATIYQFTGPDAQTRANEDGRFLLAAQGDVAFAAALSDDAGLTEAELGRLFCLVHLHWNAA